VEPEENNRPQTNESSKNSEINNLAIFAASNDGAEQERSAFLNAGYH
jgi:hypothetical protein